MRLFAVCALFVCCVGRGDIRGPEADVIGVAGEWYVRRLVDEKHGTVCYFISESISCLPMKGNQ